MEDSIWYVEARKTEESQTFNCGTAVAIWLKSGAADIGERYLITCAHVIRDEASDGTAGYGPMLKHIRVWKPDSGYNTESGLAASVIESDVVEFQEGEVAAVDRGRVSDDWVLLQVDDPRFANVPVVSRIGGTATEGLRIVGYPGGNETIKAASFKVEPRETLNFRIIAENNGVLSLTGPEETRKGMSGGGLFDPDGALLGIHRAYKDLVNAGQCISAKHIKGVLASCGFTVVENNFETTGQRWSSLRTKAFLFYDRGDSDWSNRLQVHLGVVQQQGQVSVVDPADVSPGSHKADSIQSLIRQCDVALVLVSPDLLAAATSELQLQRELLLERIRKEDIHVISLVVSPCHWETEPWIESSQVVPVDHIALSQRDNDDAERVLAELAEQVATIRPSRVFSTEELDGVRVRQLTCNEAVPERPYPILDSYRHECAFGGRGQETKELQHLMALQRLILCIHAPSGAGKSSFASAALKPRLMHAGHPVALDRNPEEPGICRRLIADLAEGELVDSLVDSDYKSFLAVTTRIRNEHQKRPVFVLDQFEALFLSDKDTARQILGPLLASTASRVSGSDQFVCVWIILYRQEYHGRITAWLRDVLQESRRLAGRPQVFLPHDLTKPDRFLDWSFPVLGQARASGDPLAAANQAFSDAILKPLNLTRNGQPAYSWRFAPGHADRLAQAFAAERLRQPWAPLVPELQVVLAHLMEESATSDGVIEVPFNPEEMIRNALGRHLHRKLDEATRHGAHLGTSSERRERTRALFALKRLADARMDRGHGVDADELAKTIGSDGRLVIQQLADVRLVFQVRTPSGNRLELAHDAIAEELRKLFEDPMQRRNYALDEELVELQQIVHRRSDLFASGDEDSAKVSRRLAKRVKQSESSLSWSQQSREWWSEAQANYDRRARNIGTAIVVSTVLLLGTLGLVLQSLKTLETRVGLEQAVRREPAKESLLSLCQLHSAFNLRGEEAWSLLAERDDLAGVLGTGWQEIQDRNVPLAVGSAIEHGYKQVDWNPELFGAMLCFLDECGRDNPYCIEVRKRLVSYLKSLRRPIQFSSEEWVQPPAFAADSSVTFTMGTNPEELQERARQDERTHLEEVSHFQILRREVKLHEYAAFDPMKRQRFASEPDLPATEISWYEANAFAAWLDARLPTEAEWEYACRGGQGSTFGAVIKNDEKELTRVAWFEEGSTGEPHRVMSKDEHGWGLYDMYGNVAEWCYDWYAPYVRGKTSSAFPASKRVVRGGSYRSGPWNVRAASRDSYLPDERFAFLGFRIARTSLPKSAGDG